MSGLVRHVERIAPHVTSRLQIHVYLTCTATVTSIVVAVALVL